ncbi:hypothetical protein H7F33_17545 [Pedobacter sp. PAMC26386]|nr:hypothetical protein H7F33_17545 [Pedobacter sp. PAMC26386]
MKSNILGLLEKINVLFTNESIEKTIEYNSVPIVNEIISSIYQNYIDETEYLKVNNTFSDGSMADFYATSLIHDQLQKREIISDPEINTSVEQQLNDRLEEQLLNQNDRFLFERGKTLLSGRTFGFLNEVSMMMNYFSKRNSALSKEYLLCLTMGLKSEFEEYGILDTVSHNFKASNTLAFGNTLGVLTLTLIKVQQVLELKDFFNLEIEIVIKWIFKSYKEADFASNKYSIFPQTVDSLTQESSSNNQLYWNQGDTLIAIILYHTSILLHDDNLFKVADLVGLNTLLRKDFNSTQIVNSSLLNGTTGLAESYRYMYKLSNNIYYLDGYHHWIKETVRILNNELIAGSLQNRNISIYRGVYGTALSLMSFVEQKNALISIDPLLF